MLHVGHHREGRAEHRAGGEETVSGIGVRANIHWGGGGQTEFCPNGECNLFVTRPRQGEKIILNYCRAFFDGRRVVPDERLLCYPTRNVSQQTTRC